MVLSSGQGLISSMIAPALESVCAALTTAPCTSLLAGAYGCDWKKPIFSSFIVEIFGLRVIGCVKGSLLSGPCIMLKSRSRSSADLDIGPIVEISRRPLARVDGQTPVSGITPDVGLNPAVPQKCAGTRIEFNPSEPTPAGLA